MLRVTGALCAMTRATAMTMVGGRTGAGKLRALSSGEVAGGADGDGGGEIVQVFSNHAPQLVQAASIGSVFFAGSMLFTGATVYEYFTLDVTGGLLAPDSVRTVMAGVFGLAGIGGGYAGRTFVSRYVAELAFNAATDEVILVVGVRESADGSVSKWLPIKAAGDKSYYVLDIDRGTVRDERLMELLLQADDGRRG
ncbi:uncharacterized protein AMSG_05683 [Thecamonas trahens ATCC 50062]|uniref:Uncharacterized protein n=1 Tax=Thecamonas trahens ATCC 50062 TaxID=461836 RepID=A0A0L0DC32_THETB|nr:hypothetical protein AMSG_05683 [Thecamonas trahens ATCC 50062]KNC49636.1 hypothetical protein AMSG_05683 [Thecamonas trahens ATCC 50062]|eukprot:XP_013757739.1 hypothetical protein AMSG_05683 [Thecamonas trahens ATCC 50062]